ncbi:hypothetical protein WOLCODRAFT_93445 [Wolfiporia cocos MD-104 SS10]|uniref:Uncharacterized protein n=1 Tax=Wolfiporia cocos (strain MD-104) TaxID=742152 RepID=A0A2H3J6Y3_WOLCO|nr:hypothetical protein WOLCODRAFT_93445 [Wolfiporia cocos MD-104 SS10]
MAFSVLVTVACLLPFLCSPTYALPVAVFTPTQPSPLAIPVSIIPLLLLGVCKFTYAKYRRAQSIHEAHEDTLDASREIVCQAKTGHRFSLDRFTGYLVGFLGSPEWETRISCRADQVARKSQARSSASSEPSSSVIYARIMGDSTGYRRSQSRSRSASALPSTSPLPSPTLMQIMEPVLTSWYDDARARDMEISQDSTSSAESKSSRSQSRGKTQTPNGLNSLTLSVYEAPSISAPSPVHTPQLRPQSCHSLADICAGITASSAGSNVSAKTSDRCSPSTSLGVQDSLATTERTAFAPTTRPLNIGPKPLVPLSPTGFLDSLSPLEIITGKQRKKSTVAQRRRSGSPQIGPSPLRNSVLLETSASMPVLEVPKPSATVPSLRASWELEDLIKDGQLDVDAVSALLGLGLTVAPDSASREHLAASPEPEQDLGSLGQEDADGTMDIGTTGMGWGRACETGVTTVQFRVPGEQLSTIIEEPDDIGSLHSCHARNSLGSMHGIVKKVSGPSLEQLIEASCGASVVDSESGSLDNRSVWAEERSWRDSGSMR